MRISIPILLALILVLPGISMAAPPNPGAYVSGFIGVSVPSDRDTSSTDFVTGKSFSDRVEFDPGINIGGTGGYDFGLVRLEGELSYKHAELKSIRDLNTGSSFRNVDGNLGVFAVMFNGFFDFHNASQVTPYIGGGIGFATLHLSDTFGTDVSGGAPTRPLIYGRADDTVFAYQAGAGIEIELTRRFSLDLGYRYFATERADFDSDVDILTSMRFESHNGALGFRFKF